MTPIPTRSTSRDAAVISGLTLASRTSGLARVLVAGAVLGRGPLGDLYQTVNTVPNIVFELLAGGALQAALVPMFVAADRDDPVDGVSRVASGVIRAMARSLAVVTGVGVLAAPLVIELLTLAEPDAEIAGDKWRLGTWMLWLFLPQILWYGLGVVATASLAARRRFAAAAVAPLVNNVVVIAAYLTFDRLRGDRGPGLDLTIVELAVLAGGTTLAVVAFTSVPVFAARRAGLRFRVRAADPGRPAPAVYRAGGWAVVHVGAAMGLQLAVLVVGNGAPGGVALFTWGLTFFLLPAALVALPVATALAPRAADLHQRGAWGELASAVGAARRTAALSGVMAAVGLFAVARPLVEALPLGELGSGGLTPVVHTIQAFAPGIVGYSMWALGSRVLFSVGETRTAAIDTVVGAAAGVVAMVVAGQIVSDGDRAAALAGSYGAAFTIAAALVWVSVHRALHSVGQAQE